MARVLVVGAGALGSLLGALLTEAGHDAFLVGRGEHVAWLRHDGLRLEGGAYGPDRVVPLRAGEAAPEGFAPDLVVLAVKTQDLDAAFTQHGAAMRAAPVVALQNGLAQDDIVRQRVGPARVVAAISALDATFVEPGRVHCDHKGALVLGAPFDEARASVDVARAILSDALSVRVARDARAARWTKLIINLGNVVPALSGLPFQETARHKMLSKVHVRLMREGLRVAKAERVRLEALPYTSPFLLRLFLRLPERTARRVYAARARRVLGASPFYGSTWQSLRRGVGVETEWLNGEVVRRGKDVGVATPVNAAAARLMREAGRERVEADELARRLLS